jgi:uncharacterized protein (DUF885 family)
MTARDLADEYLDFRRRVDVWRNLWAGDMTYLDEWDDPAPEATAATVERFTAFRDEATERSDGADADDRALLGTIAATAEVSRLMTDLEYDLDIPNPETGLLGFLVPFLPRYRLVTHEDGERYLTKLERFPEFADAMAARMRIACARGVNPLRSHAERLESALAARVADPSHWYHQAAPLEGFDGWDDRLRAAVDGPLAEGLRRYAAGLEACAIPNGRGDDRAGLMHIPDGAVTYDHLVKAHTTLDLSAEEVHQTGLQQVARLADEYLEIAGPVLGSSDLTEILDRLSSDPDLHYTDGDAVVAGALAALDRAVAASPDWFSRIPDGSCDGVAIDGGALAFYSRPKVPGGPGTFFFNTADPTVWTTFGLEAIAYHESVPGHHLQIALAVEDPTLHECQTRLYVAAFNEGWGLYSERLADEMGLYTSAMARIGMLQADSMRACRLVVDTGMHALGWSREQAIDYMASNSPMNRQEVAAEIDRYITAPAQALGYMIGRLEIDKVRSSAEGALGDRFDIKGFHEALLGAGTITLPIMRERVDAWVASAA